MHGGLSPSIEKLDQIRKFERSQEIPQDGALSDLLWSDPDEKEGYNISNRGAGFLWGPDVTKKFNYENGLNAVIRAHQLVNEVIKRKSGICAHT